MKFFLLYTIGLLNLVLGYAVARHLLPTRPTAAGSPPGGPHAGEEEPEEAADAGAVLVELMARLQELTSFLGAQLDLLEGPSCTPELLGELAADLSEQVQQVLRAVCQASETCARQGEDRQEQADGLDRLWEEISDWSSRVVALEPEDVDRSQPLLTEICREVQQICVRAMVALG